MVQRTKIKDASKTLSLCDVDTTIPTFFHITIAAVNNRVAMDETPYAPKAYYIFDHGYKDFKRLFEIKTT